MDNQSSQRAYVQQMHSSAWQDLRHPENLSPKLGQRGLRFGLRQLQLWRDAQGFYDFEPHTLTVYQPFDDDSRPLVRKAIWHRDISMQPLHQQFDHHASKKSAATPSMTAKDAELDAIRLQSFFDRAAELAIPIAWRWQKHYASVTTDTGHVGFEFFDQSEPQASIRCSWSVDTPPGWEPVQEWFGDVFTWLDGHFKRSGGVPDGVEPGAA